MSKFRIGDIVKTKRGLEVDEWYGGCMFNEDMMEFEGKLAKVTKKNSNGSFKLDIDNELWNWTEEMLTPQHKSASDETNTRLEVNELTPKEKVVHLREFLVDESKLIVDESEEELLDIEDWEFLHSLLDCCIKHKIKTLF